MIALPSYEGRYFSAVLAVALAQPHGGARAALVRKALARLVSAVRAAHESSMMGRRIAATWSTYFFGSFLFRAMPASVFMGSSAMVVDRV